MSKVLGSCVIALAVVGPSCGGGDADSPSSFASAYCDLLQPCCAMANLRADGQQCRLFFGLASTSKYDAQKGEACLAELRVAAQKPDFCSNLSSAEPTSCDQVFESTGGTKQPGETCDEDDDCAPSTEGEVECATGFGGGGSSQVRKCQVQVRGKAGDTPCVGTVEGNVTSYSSSGEDVPARGYLCHVADGLRCDLTTHACVAFKAVGEACAGSSNECVKEAYCDRDARKCAARKAVGGACEPGFFSSDECVEGAYCKEAGAAAGTCTARLADGAACSEDDECLSDNCVNAKCDKGGGFGDFGLALLCGSK